jgi:hypothetical protein
MEPVYLVVFAVLAGVAAFLELSKSKIASVESTSKEFIKFRSNYVLVYSLMMGEFVKMTWQHVYHYPLDRYCINP